MPHWNPISWKKHSIDIFVQRDSPWAPLIFDKMFDVVVLYCVQLVSEVNMFQNPCLLFWYTVAFVSYYVQFILASSPCFLWCFCDMKFPKIFLICGTLYGVPAGFQKDFCGNSLVFPLDSYDMFMKCLWDFYWGTVRCPQYVYDISIGLLLGSVVVSPWWFLDISKGCQTGISIGSRGISMMCLKYFYDMSMGFWLGVYGVSLMIFRLDFFWNPKGLPWYFCWNSMIFPRDYYGIPNVGWTIVKRVQ